VNQSFAWMFGGLLLTALASFIVASNNAMANLILNNNIVFFGLIIIELVLVFFLSLRVQRMSFGAALTTFLVYSVLNGLTISAIFFVYTASSIAVCFLISALVFGVMALYGYTTKRDLTSIGNLAFMALIGVILASVINLFLNSTALGYIVSYIAIVIFVALTAYDTQKIKRMAESGASENMGVWGALALYLDFINIFLNLLRIFGRQRD
jgi:hypothetical protein